MISFANGYRKQPQMLSGLFEFSVDAELSEDEVEEVRVNSSQSIA